MSIEILGSRIFAPFFGNSVITWTAIIGVILTALSIGYWWGGKVSEIKDVKKLYSDIFLTASIMAILILFEKYFLLTNIAQKTGLEAGSLISALICFGPINFLLGATLPIASVIVIGDDYKKSGEVFGLVSAISTVGSILGVLLTGFTLLPNFSLDTITISIGIVLALTSILTEIVPKKIFFFILITLISIGLGLKTKNFLKNNVIYSGDTLYNHIEIIKDTDPLGRVKIHLTTGKNEVQSSSFADNTNSFPEEYKRYFRLIEVLNPNFRNVLMIGGGAFTSPKDFLSRYKNSQITVIEIDPALKILAKEYFGLKDDPRLTIIDDDARLFLNKNSKTYDLIIMDAFEKNISPPFQLTTIESTKEMYSSLSSNGILMANIIGSQIGPGSEFLNSELATYKAIFPHVYTIPVEYKDDPNAMKNIIVIAAKNNLFTLPAPGISESASLLSYASEFKDTKGKILTDNFAPVEYQLLSLYKYFSQ